MRLSPRLPKSSRKCGRHSGIEHPLRIHHRPLYQRRQRVPEKHDLASDLQTGDTVILRIEKNT